MAELKKLSEVEYRKLQRLNASGCKDILKSPKTYHWKHILGNESEQTKEMRFGSLFHTYVLEPEKRDLIQVSPGFNLRTNAGKEKQMEWAAQFNFDAITCTEDEYLCVTKMHEALMNHKEVRDLLESGMSEMTALFDIDGVNMKAKIDHISEEPGHPVIIDLKTSSNASRDGFRSSTRLYGYDIQALLYLRACEAVYNRSLDDFRFIFVEKTPPYNVEVWSLEPDQHAQGEEKLAKAIGLYKYCMQRGEWLNATEYDPLLFLY